MTKTVMALCKMMGLDRLCIRERGGDPLIRVCLIVKGKDCDGRESRDVCMRCYCLLDGGFEGNRDLNEIVALGFDRVLKGEIDDIVLCWNGLYKERVGIVLI